MSFRALTCLLSLYLCAHVQSQGADSTVSDSEGSVSNTGSTYSGTKGTVSDSETSVSNTEDTSSGTEGSYWESTSESYSGSQTAMDEFGSGWEQSALEAESTGLRDYLLSRYPSNTTKIRVVYMFFKTPPWPDQQIPEDLPSMFPNLRFLDIVGCLKGEIPSSLGSMLELEELVLASNNLEGPIPASLGNLTKLRRLMLDNNKINGTLPPELGRLHSLTYFSVRETRLTGAIPASFGQLKRLSYLDLSRNNFAGPIPGEFGGMRNLSQLLLIECGLTGPIPPQLGNLRMLEGLQLSQNKLNGTIPAELGKLQALEAFSLYDNNLTGVIPPELGNLQALSDFRADFNELSGSIPASFGKLHALTRLYLPGNRLSGSIPAELGNLSLLNHLVLSSNRLTGRVPAELGNLSRITNLFLDGNELSGAIPATVGGWSRATHVKLGNNRLSGQLPEEIGAWRSVRQVELNDNQLTGHLPRSIGNLVDLTFIQLGSNSFSGKIPDEVEHWVRLLKANLSSNQFSGAVPNGLRNWTEAQDIDFQYNQLTALPDNLHWLRSLEVFRLQGNSLEELPDLYNLVKLLELHVNENALVSVDWLPASLKVLDLSRNRLRELPLALDYTTQLQSLNVAQNLIGQWADEGTVIESGGLWVTRISWRRKQFFSWPKLRVLDVSGNPLLQVEGDTPRENTLLNRFSPVQIFLDSLAGLESLTVLSCRRCNLTGPLLAQTLPGLADVKKCPGTKDDFICNPGAPTPGFGSLQILDLAENEISHVMSTPPPSLMRADFSRNALEQLSQSWFNLQGRTSLVELKITGNPQLRADVSHTTGDCGEPTLLVANPQTYIPQDPLDRHECTQLCRGRVTRYDTDAVLDESALCRCRAGYEGSGRDCKPCDQDTYSRKEDLHGAVRTCQRCPTYSDTGGVTKAASISDCKCTAGTYLNTSATACSKCPQWPYRTTKSRGQAEVSSCSCNATYSGLKEFNELCGCDDGYYMNHAQKVCTKCSNSEMCLWGVNLDKSLQPPRVKPGFWSEPILNLDTFSGNSIWRCTGPESCHEGGVCAEGRQGVACGLCKPGTSGPPDGACQPCSEDLTIEARRGLLALGILLAIVPAVLVAHVGLTGAAESFSLLMQLRSVRISVKQMVKHLQSVSVIGGMSVTWPQIAHAFFDILDLFTLNVPNLLAAGCLQVETSAWFEMAVKWAMPPVFLLLTMLALPVSWLCARVLRTLHCHRGGLLQRKLDTLADEIVMTPADAFRVLLFALTLFWSNVVANSLEILTCIPSPNGRLTVATYPDVECDMRIPDYLVLALCSFLTILLYMAIPLRILYRGYQQGTQTIASSLRAERGFYAFLFEDFRDGRLKWLLIIMVKDALFVLTPAALPGQGAAQLLLSACIAAGHGLWVINSAPYHERSNTLLEGWNSASAAILCIYSVGMGYEATAGMEDVEELFQNGAEDSIYRGRAIGMVVVQVVTVAVPAAVLVFQLICAVERTRQMLPRRVKPASHEESERWLQDFVRDAKVGEELANLLKAFDETDLHIFRTLMQNTSAAVGHCLSNRSSSPLVRLSRRLQSGSLEMAQAVEQLEGQALTEQESVGEEPQGTIADNHRDDQGDNNLPVEPQEAFEEDQEHSNEPVENTTKANDAQFTARLKHSL